jgi:hypothetical protein
MNASGKQQAVRTISEFRPAIESIAGLFVESVNSTYPSVHQKNAATL